MDEAAEDLTEAVKDLTQSLEESAVATGAVTALVDSINRARTSVSNTELKYPHFWTPGLVGKGAVS